MTARTADEAVALALSLVGRTEHPTNSNRLPLPEGGTLWSAVGLAGYDKARAPWCGGFVQYVLGPEASGIPASTMAYTPAAIAAYRGRGWAVTAPQPGDLVWFNFSGGRSPEHVGLVLAVNKDGSIISVEGNTSPGDAGSQSNGGGVFRRIRPARYVVGYGRPRYALPAPVAPPTVTTTLEVDLNIQLMDVRISTDGNGSGWTVAYAPVDKIVGFLPPGLRPGADGRYLTPQVAFAQEDDHTIVSVTGWAPNQVAIVRLRVAA